MKPSLFFAVLRFQTERRVYRDYKHLIPLHLHKCDQLNNGGRTHFPCLPACSEVVVRCEAVYRQLLVSVEKSWSVVNWLIPDTDAASVLHGCVSLCVVL